MIKEENVMKKIAKTFRAVLKKEIERVIDFINEISEYANEIEMHAG